MMTKSLVQQILLSSLVTVGAAAVCALIGPWAGQFLPAVGPIFESPESLAFLGDGTPLIQRYDEDGTQQEYRDLQGRLVVPPSAEGRLMPALLPKSWWPISPMATSRLSDGQPPPAYWYLLEDQAGGDGAGYFVGFESRGNYRIGYIGLSGFREDVPPRSEMIPAIRRSSKGVGLDSDLGLYFLTPQNGAYYQNGGIYQYVYSPGIDFHPPAAWEVYVPGSDGKLYFADLRSRTVRVIYDGPPLNQAAIVGRNQDSRQVPIFQIVIRTADQVMVLDLKGKIESKFPIPTSLRNEEFAVVATTKGEAVMQWASPADSLNPTTSIRLFHVQNDGQFQETQLSLHNNSAASQQRAQVYGGLEIPSPAIFAGAVGFGRVFELLQQRLVPTLGEAVRRTAREYGPTFLLALAISVVLASLCYFRLARYKASRLERIVWPLFVLVLGLPGWIGYRFGRTWPVLEACPACTIRSPRDRYDCVACGEEFRAPAELGTEVFA
jgi:hypothetical protein